MKFSIDRTSKRWPFNTGGWLCNRGDCIARFDCTWFLFVGFTDSCNI